MPVPVQINSLCLAINNTHSLKMGIHEGQKKGQLAVVLLLGAVFLVGHASCQAVQALALNTYSSDSV